MSFSFFLILSVILVGLACLLLLRVNRGLVDGKSPKSLLLECSIIGVILTWPVWIEPFREVFRTDVWILLRSPWNIFSPVLGVLYGAAIFFQHKMEDSLAPENGYMGYTMVRVLIGIAFLCLAFFLFSLVVLMLCPYYSSDRGEQFILYFPYGFAVSAVIGLFNSLVYSSLS